MIFLSVFSYFYSAYPSRMQKIIACFLVAIVLSFSGYSQQKTVYTFPLEDTALKSRLFREALAVKESMINTLPKENKEEYTTVYNERFALIESLMKSNRLIAEPDAHAYLQRLLQLIVDANPELKQLKIRLVFSRDNWPNAYSIGEGTLVINAALLLRMKTEAELVFVLCHEIAHYYLDHSGKSISKRINLLSSPQFKSDIKRLSKQEYGAGEELDRLLMSMAFGLRKHSRENEAEADATGLRFMKSTGYTGSAAITCLQMLDKVDETTLFPAIDIQSQLGFADYPFRKKWIINESGIFSQMKGDASELTQAERDSLRTHPDCPKRIEANTPVVSQFGAGNDFKIDATFFQQLKDRFTVEIAEELFREEKYTQCLWYNLGLLKAGMHRTYALYATARVLNALYEAQLTHKFGLVAEKENKTRLPEYNQLLRMFDRLRLDELAEISFQFCKQYRTEMAGYTSFENEWQTAAKNHEKYTN